MTPGLQRGPPFPAKATKGAIVAIASLEAPTVPMAIGTCEIDVSALQDVRGAKGHAVSTVHWAGDELWSWSSSSKPGIEPPENIDAWAENTNKDTALAEQTAALDVNNQEGGVSLAPESGTSSKEPAGGDDKTTMNDAIDFVDDKELTTKGELDQNCL